MKKNVSLKTKILIMVSFVICFFASIIINYQNNAVYNLVLKNASFFLNRQNEALASRIVDYSDETDNEIRSTAFLFSGNFLAQLNENPQKILAKISDIKRVNNILASIDQNTFILLTRFGTDIKTNDTYFSSPIAKDSNFAFGLVKIDNHGKVIQKNIIYYNNQLQNTGIANANDLEIETYISSIQKTKDQRLNSEKAKILDLSKITKKTVLTQMMRLANDNNYLYVESNLTSLALSLDANRISENTQLFLIDGQQMLISESNIGTNTQLRNIHHPALELLKIAYASDISKRSTSNRNFFTHKNKNYISLIKSFPIISKLDWKIITISPTEDFSIEANKIKMNSILISILLLILILFWLFFYVNKYSQPLNYLGIEAEKIRQFDLEDSVYIESNTKEIVNLTAETQNMKTSVKNFSQFIPKGLLEKLVNSGQDIEIGGKVMPVTLFFSDIEGFTTISEGMDPNLLSIHLSEYLEELTTVIAQSKGTIDKYIGDSIMAFWGAPDADEKQAYHACRSALICQQKITVLNRYWKAQGKPELRTRIGIHTGDAVIGNMGSSERMNYTAIGDNVNLAARLEGTNKMYNTKILISQSTLNALPANFVTRPVDVVAVKGKSFGIKIFELIGIEKDDYLTSVSQEEKEKANIFTKGFDLYLSQDFKNAIPFFEKLAQEDDLSAKYIKRCQDLIASPPPANWDGIMHLKEK